MYGCVLILIGFRNYSEESQRAAVAFKSHTFLFFFLYISEKRKGSFRYTLTSLGLISYGDLFGERCYTIYICEKNKVSGVGPNI